jgi:hypothetical protein
VTSVLPASGIPLDVSVAPYVALDATGGALVVGRLMDDTLHASSTAAQWIASAYTPRGAAVWADRRAVTIGGNHRGTGDGEPTGIVSSLQLQPGRYEVRSSISTQTGDIGSVYAYVDVPDFANDSLALSGLLLNVAGETAQIPDSQLRAALPFAPTTLRELARHTSASAFAQVVEGTKRHDPLHAVAVDASIQDADGHLLWQRQSHVEARAFDARRIAGVTVPLPINELGAGRYLFQLRTSVADRTVTRSLSFEIK